MSRAKSILGVCITERYQFSRLCIFVNKKLTPKNRYSLSVLELAYLSGAQLNCHCKQKKRLSLSHCAFRPIYSVHQLIYSQSSLNDDNTAFPLVFFSHNRLLSLWKRQHISLSAHRVHRVAMATTFWRTFHYDRNISQAWQRWGLHAHPLSLYLPSLTKLQCTL
jgi:hypothetical protein